MGDLEVLAASACHHSHTDLPVQVPQYLFRPIDHAWLSSQGVGVHAVTPGPKLANFVGRNALVGGQLEHAFAPPQRNLAELGSRQVDADSPQNGATGSKVEPFRIDQYPIIIPEDGQHGLPLLPCHDHNRERKVNAVVLPIRPNTEPVHPEIVLEDRSNGIGVVRVSA